MSTETQRAKFFTWEEVHEMAMKCHSSDEILQAAQIRLQSLCDIAAQAAQSSQAAELAALKAENEALRLLLEKARAGLSGGLWDYGPEQYEHEQCQLLIEEIDAAMQTKEAS